jgi:SAM-dependent methyltransferase
VSRVLDVGCGQGGFLDRARAAGLQTAGLDASPAAVAAARERGFDVRLASAAAHPFEDEPPFDLITMWDVLEHLEDPRAALTGCLHRLAPGGRLVVLTPAMGSVFDRVGLAIYRAAGPRADRLLRMCWSAQHLLRFEPGGLCAVLRDLGFAGARSRRVQVLSLHDSHYAGSAIMPAWSRSSRVNRAISRAGVALARVLHVTNKVLVTAETPRHVH